MHVWWLLCVLLLPTWSWMDLQTPCCSRPSERQVRKPGHSPTASCFKREGCSTVDSSPLCKISENEQADILAKEGGRGEQHEASASEKIIISKLKGRIGDFLQSSHCAANCLQRAHSSGPGTIVCKSCATHRALSATCNMWCATFQQHPSVLQGRICSDSCTCFHTEIDIAGHTFCLTCSILTPGQPVPALILYHQALDRVATGVPIFKPLV